MATYQPAVVTQPAVGPEPASMRCPHCGQNITTSVTYMNGLLTWLCVIVLFFIFWPIMCVPCCCAACRDAQHTCPSCNRIIAIHKRI